MKPKKTVAVLFVFLIIISSFGKPVKAYGSSLTLSRTSISIDVGKSSALTATVTNSADTVSFVSSNSSIASVAQSSSRVCTITGTGIGTATITATCSNGDTATCTVTVAEVFPAPNAQNKEVWCWAAASKKVGVHNGGAGALPTGKAYLIDTYGKRPAYCGRMSLTIYTVDAGQKAIVMNAYGNDGNNGGSDLHIQIAVQYASLRTLTTGVVGSGSWSALTDTQRGRPNSELAAGHWVVGGINTADGSSSHAIVITGYNTSTGVYTYWDPWDDYYSTFTDNNIGSITLHSLDTQSSFLLTSFVYAY